MPLLVPGDGLWPPLATAIAGGDADAALLALTFVPATFAWSHRPSQLKPEPEPKAAQA
ncbi:MAG: hypothetical protein ACI8QS_003721 [Planctomycetota bacterium]|jgi:hypothetical protein